MDNFVILADGTCDLSKENQEKYNIEIVYGHVSFPDKGDMPAFLDWSYYPKEEFYKNLSENPDGFKTAPPNVAEFAEAMERHVKEGQAVLLMTISGGISGSISFAEQAKQMVLEKYKDGKIYCLDSRRFGPGFGLLVIYASNLRKEGKSFEDTITWLEDNKNKFHQAGWLDDLSFVAKKGRISHPKAFMGTLVGVKPIGEFDSNGLTTVIGKVKGNKKAYEVLISYIRDTIVDPENQIITIAQTNRLKQAEEYKKLIEENFHPKEVYINDVFPACGINIGPGLMACYYMGTPISENLEFEKQLINKYI